MSRREVLSEAARRRMFLSPDALEIIMSRQEPLAFTNTVLQSLAGNPMFVTKEDVLACLEGDAPAFVSPPEVRPSVRRSRSEIKVVDGTDITGNSTCEGTIEDFARYFQSRYSILKRIIERNRALDYLDEIRAQLPAEVEEAKKLMAARAEYVANAKKEAENLRQRAQNDGDDDKDQNEAGNENLIHGFFAPPR